MELRKIIRTDIAASAIAHLTLVALIIVISEVHPFHAAPPEAVAVDIVTPEQVKEQETKAEEAAKEKAPEPTPTPELRLPKLDVTDKADAAAKPAAKQQAASQSSQQKASPEPEQSTQQKQPQPQPSQTPKQREATAQPQPEQPQQPQPQPSQLPPQQPLPQSQPQPAPQPSQGMPQPQAAPPAYQAPEPDVTVKYGVMLGLPPELPVEPKDAPRDDGGDAKDSIGAKLPPEVIAELRRRLRSCAKLPAGVAPTDPVRIKLRAVFATDGTLARPPILIEAPPSAKGVAIVKSATSALQACQPYKMLPADKYEEWKVLDLPFTPQDFGGG
ncbi:cell division protein FtsN [Bradyrhizobium diazoefficiens]